MLECPFPLADVNVNATYTRSKWIETFGWTHKTPVPWNPTLTWRDKTYVVLTVWAETRGAYPVRDRTDLVISCSTTGV